MNIDLLSLGDSALHRIDPRVRLTTAAGFSVAAAVSHSILALAGALAVSVALASLARLRPGHVAARLCVVNGLVACIWALVPFTTPGEALFRVGPFAASREGVELAGLITLKTNAIVLCFMALVATMAPTSLGHALHRLRVPDKLVFLFLMAYRYIFVLEQEYQRLVRAQKDLETVFEGAEALGWQAVELVSTTREAAVLNALRAAVPAGEITDIAPDTRGFIDPAPDREPRQILMGDNMGQRFPDNLVRR